MDIDPEQNEKVKAAIEYLTEVFAAMGVTGVEFHPVQKGEATILHVTGGKQVSALIGRRGETMEALSYLASLVANRLGGDYMKLGLDVAGYRNKREADLEALAKRLSEKVIRTGRSIAVEPMNPYERRIIHSAVGKIEGVRSESEGDGPDRRVVIYSTDPNASNVRDRSSERRAAIAAATTAIAALAVRVAAALTTAAPACPPATSARLPPVRPLPWRPSVPSASTMPTVWPCMARSNCKIR